MDFGNIGSRCLSSSLVAHTPENRFSQDTQHRYRKSPRKKLKATQTSALIIDQLKSGFRRPGDFAPRTRTRRNWRPECLIRYLRDIQCECNEDAGAVQCDKNRARSFAPETPRIYSIGLRSNVINSDDINDLSNLCALIRSFKKRIVRRAMIVCKYWIAHSNPTSNLSTAISLKERATHQTMIIDYTESANIVKFDWTQRNSRHYNHSCHCNHLYQIEEKDDDDDDRLNTLRDNRVADTFIADIDEFATEKERKVDGSYATKKDAQIQTSSRKSSRRKKSRKKSKPINEGILHRKNGDDEPTLKTPRGETVANLHCADSHKKSNRKSQHSEKSRLFIRVLENKRAEYINKFTAVNQQIEEITATLRETCYNDKNSRSELENCEKYSSSLRNDAKVKTRRDTDIENNSTIHARRKNTLKRETNLINVQRILKKLENNKNVRESLNVSDINDETPVFSSKRSSKNATVCSTKHDNLNVNDVFVRDPIQAFAIKEAIRPSKSGETPEDKKRCHFVKQISFNVNSAKEDDEIEDESVDEACLNNNLVISNYDHYSKVSSFKIEDFADLGKSKYRKYRKHNKFVEEKINEMAVLEDIKRRIDRDFDDPSNRSENEMEDFLTVSRKSSNSGKGDSQFYRLIPKTPLLNVSIKESKSAPLITSDLPNLDSAETQIRNATSVGAMSEYSNKNSNLSKYYSCTQFSSLISLRENEDEFAVASVEDQSIVDHDSYPKVNYYDLHRNTHINCSHPDSSLRDNCSRSNLNLNYDRSHSSLECIMRRDKTAQYTTPNKCLIELINESVDKFEMNQEIGNKIGNDGYLPKESNEKGCNSCADLEKQCAADSTLETSRYIGSIDSGVFVSSSLIDLYPHEESFDSSKLELKRKQCRRVKRLDGSSPILDFSSDSSCTDDELDRKVDDVVEDLTNNLILCERRARMKLKDMRKSQSPVCKFSEIFYDSHYDLYDSSQPCSEDERILSVSTPSLLSLSNSETEDAVSYNHHSSIFVNL